MINPTTPDQFLWQFIPLFIGMWVSISLLLSLIGGWRKLAEVYKADEKIEGYKWPSQSGSTRFGVSYNHCLIIKANNKGIQIGISLMFRLGHPTLFIPWKDVTVTKQKLFFWELASFRFTKIPNVPFRISTNLAEKIKSAVGDAWPTNMRQQK